MTHMAQPKNSMKVFLFVSVLLNVFLIGFATSSYLNRPMHGPPPHAGDTMHQFEEAKKHLSTKGQDIIDQILNEQSNKLRDDTDAMQQAIQEAEKILLAPELDQNALKQIHQEMDRYNIAMKANLSETIYKIAVQLSSEDRIKFFKAALPRPPHANHIRHP